MDFKRIGIGSGENSLLSGDKIALEREYKEAKRLGPVRVSGKHVFLCKAFRAEYMKPEDVAWVYLRQEDILGSVGCRHMAVEHYSLMIVAGDGTERKISLQDKAHGEEIISELKAANPCLDVGFTAELKTKYNGY